MKQLYLFCLFTLVYFQALSQSASVKGVLQDTVEFKTVAYSTVMAIKVADSTILRFTHTRDNGQFMLDKLPAGKIRLLISRPGFADYEDQFDLMEGEQKELGRINMLSKTNLLKEVIIRDRLEAIRIKGDTTEFLVDSFLTNKNASVEDLMKRLPGIQVDKDGKITAHGKEVKKVLVDGEEFFGDDPTIATKNIKATQVESVQVFDKKSEQASITGVDDGVKEKTINLKLKEEAKKGYFGKVAAGAGTEDRYEHDVMLNKFNRKQKFSVYGAASNTNKTSLSWEDNQKYGGDGDQNFYVDDDGNSYMYYNNNSNFDGVGIPRTWYAGAHYSDKKNNDKHAYSINASHKEMNVDGFDSNYTKYILPDTFYFNNQKNEINNFKRKNSVSGNYTLAYDSFTTIKLKLSGTQGDYKNRSTYRSENRNEESRLVNSNNRTNNEDGQDEGINGSLNYIRKFRKQNRSVSLGATIDYNKQTSDGFLLSSTNFYYSDTGFVTNSIDQKKENHIQTNHYTFNGTYTEPLTKKFSLISDYSLNVNNDQSTRITLEKSSTPQYDTRLDSLSNDFRYNVLVNRGGLTLKYQYKKITTSAGGRISYTDLQQNNLVNNQQQTQTFTNYFPSARFNYKIGTSSAFDLSYNGNTRQPTLQQIQPIIDNTNPLDLYIGNTALTQSFSNTYRATYNFYKPLTGTSLWSNASFTHTYDAFAMRDYVDTSGRRVHQTVNTDGNRSFYAQVYHNIQLKKLKMGLHNSLNANIMRNVNFVNNLENVNNSQSLTYGLDLSKDKEDVYYISVEGNWTYNRSTTSIRPDVLTEYWLQEYQLYIQFELPLGFSLESDVTYNIRQKTPEFNNNLNTTIINVGLERAFGKKENLEAGFYVRDLLNQNIGFRRTANSNFINENVHTVLRRYFMLKLTYNFSSANREKKEEAK